MQQVSLMPPFPSMQLNNSRISANHDKEDGLSADGDIFIRGIVSLLYNLFYDVLFNSFAFQQLVNFIAVVLSVLSNPLSNCTKMKCFETIFLPINLQDKSSQPSRPAQPPPSTFQQPSATSTAAQSTPSAIPAFGGNNMTQENI
jgi:hypothetical protein